LVAVARRFAKGFDQRAGVAAEPRYRCGMSDVASARSEGPAGVQRRHGRIRIWDLPTRLFHWLLVLAILGLVITGQVGGGAMVWHFRLGYVVLALLLFRIVWGLVGGHWSRFATFVRGPRAILAYLRGQAGSEAHAGHNPLGALSVLALLGMLLVQVACGLVADDEIAFVGPLNHLVSSEWALSATHWHKGTGKLLLVALVALHVAAILFYRFRRRQDLVRPMLHGDKELPETVRPARDDGRSRALAAVILAICAGVAAWVSSLGG
jgi:cytochrome b